MRYRATVAGKTYDVTIERGPSGRERVLVRGPGAVATEPVEAGLLTAVGSLDTLRLGERVAAANVVARPDGAVEVGLPGLRPLRVEVEDGRAPPKSGAAGKGRSGPATLRAVMPGIVRSVLVEAGKRVAVNDPLLIVEAMKMQNEIRAEADAVIARVHVRAGQSVASGEALLELAAGS